MFLRPLWRFVTRVTPLPSHTTIRYRAHIDGLRGVAVLLVVFYHAQLFGFHSGFIGVDIFFVLSGFLITTILLRDMESGIFSLGKFWERRIRRILPALVVVVLASVIASYFLILYPPDFHRFGNTVMAQSLFASNVLFMLTDNYFDQPSAHSPLLHTWSLAVEEQFYVLFPLLALWSTRITKWPSLAKLVACVMPQMSKFRKILVLKTNSIKNLGQKEFLFVCIAFLSVCSFLWNVWLVNMVPSSPFTFAPIPEHFFWGTTNSTAGFFLLPSRLWELGVGVLLALNTRRIYSRVYAETLSVLSLVAIALSALCFSETSPFPGLIALLPVLGTAGLIYGNENHATVVGRLLSFRPLIFFGLLSYSLYLWHWPMLVYARMVGASPETTIEKILFVLLMVCVAWLSVRFVEKPFRSKEMLRDRFRVFLFGGFVLVMFFILGFGIARSEYESSKRISQDAKDILRYAGESVPWGSECFRHPDRDERFAKVCRIGDQTLGDQSSFVLWGDSHADALAPVVHEQAERHHVSGVVFAEANCPPVIGAGTRDESLSCDEEKKYAMDYIQKKNIPMIVLIARWNHYITGGTTDKSELLFRDEKITATSSVQSIEVFEKHFLPMVEKLSGEGRRVVVVLQSPEQAGFDPKSIFADVVTTGLPYHGSGVLLSEHVSSQERVNAVIALSLRYPGVIILDPTPSLCGTGPHCPILRNGQYLYRDENHLSTAGANVLDSILEETLFDRE